jgi:hypothetical protein
MMALLLLATLASLVASLVLGVRLLRLAAGTREIPELCIGLSFISAGVIGYVLMLMGNPANPKLTPDQIQLFFTWGYGFISAGVACLYVFIWRTFRRNSSWGMWLLIAGCALTLGTSAPAVPPPGLEPSLGPGFWIGTAARLGAGAWGAAESLRWWWLLRRRLKLGLADPTVANRFLLWGISNVGTFLIFLGTSATVNTEGETLTLLQIALISSVTLTVAATQWLAFFPSKTYQGWIDRRARAKYPALNAA